MRRAGRGRSRSADGHRTSNRRFARDIGRHDDFLAIGVHPVHIIAAEFLPHPERLRRARDHWGRPCR